MWVWHYNRSAHPESLPAAGIPHKLRDNTISRRARRKTPASRLQGGTFVIDKAFDRIARAIEVTLALAFIAAVLLNFANVVGRYLFGISLLGSDEVQIFIMVGMTFIGAAVVSRRNLHLRMDVLLRFLPASVRMLLRVVEQLLLAVLAGFVLTQSYFYARQMLRIGRTSDMAGVPMWIPHGTVALGFALILIVAVWGLVRMARRMPERSAADEVKL
jgi:TRAP-type C4-dicarboxylate transport system permease small subunit